MTGRPLFTVMLALLPMSALGEVRPQPGGTDPHVQFVDFRPDQVTLIEAVPGYQVAITLAPDEQIVSVALGDSNAWQAAASRTGGRLFIKLLQPGAATNMTVITNVREYLFELSPSTAPASAVAYTIRFRYPEPPAATVAAATPKRVIGRYRLSGAQALRPSGIDDDGERTYIQWPADVALPATYALDGDSGEVLVNGNMREGAYVIDSVPGTLLFRIDKQRARADRIVGKRRR